MEITDLASLNQQGVRLGLLTEEQIQEAVAEAHSKENVAEILRILESKGYLTQWQSAKLLKGDTDGYYLGGYRLLYKIASGSFGRVFRADDPSTGRVVAVKVLRRRWSEDQQRIDLFFREGRVGMSLKHPNIVEILAVGQDPASGQYYIVMEFVEGGNLREILQIRKRFSVAEALKIIEEASAGLAYAYTRGVTHRDMKLTNVLISATNTAKLVDFGLAQFSAGPEDKEKVDRTVDYAGLERATGVKPGDVRSDIYFLGCVLYELLTGRPPLQMTKDKNARMQRRRFEEVEPMSPNEFNAPPSVFLLVETMMSLDVQQRYQTPNQLLEMVKNVRRDVEGRPDSAGPVQRSLYLVERNETLKEKLRETFKEMGYRVLIASNPNNAFDRFRRHPYDVLIVDARTVGFEGMQVFEMVLAEAERKNLRVAGVIILGDDQADWQERLKKLPRGAALIDQDGHPLTIKRLNRTLNQLLEV